MLLVVIIGLLIVSVSQALEDSAVIGLSRRAVPEARPNVWHRHLNFPRRQIFSKAIEAADLSVLKQEESKKEEKFEAVPLKKGMGTHFTWLYAGTPAQRVSVIVDTGSYLTAFPCAGCTTCGKHTDKNFQMINSNTAEFASCAVSSQCRCSANQKCIIREVYGEGSSWTATMLYDRVFLGNGTKKMSTLAKDNSNQLLQTKMPIGCQTMETGLFESQVANGIMGMGNSEQTIISHLKNSKKLRHRTFSLCFTPNGGSMVLGKVQSYRHLEKVQWAKIVTFRVPYLYAVNVKDIQIGKSSMFTGRYELRKAIPAFVDSGTTDSFLPIALKKPFLETFLKVTGLKFISSGRYCKGYTGEQKKNLPDINYILEGIDGNDVVLKFSPDIYLGKSSNGLYCSTLKLSGQAVIGANLMMHREVIFDSDEPYKGKIGFAKAKCDFDNVKAKSSSFFSRVVSKLDDLFSSLSHPHVFN